MTIPQCRHRESSLKIAPKCLYNMALNLPLRHNHLKSLLCCLYSGDTKDFSGHHNLIYLALHPLYHYLHHSGFFRLLTHEGVFSNRTSPFLLLKTASLGHMNSYFSFLLAPLLSTQVLQFAPFLYSTIFIILLSSLFIVYAPTFRI